MRRLLVTVFSISLLLAAPINANAVSAAKPGAVCTKAGLTQTVSGKKYTCVKSGKKFVWNKGVSAKASPAVPATTNPATSVSEAWKNNAWTKFSILEETAKALAEFKSYSSVKRANTALVIKSEPGVPSYWTEWVTKGSGLVADSFEYPAVSKPIVIVLAKTKQWMLDTFTTAIGTQEADGQLRAWDHAPAWAGTVSNTYDIEFVDREDLINRDNAGMKQTTGHEFFHTVQMLWTGGSPKDIPQWFWEGAALFVGHAAASQNGFNTYTGDGRPHAVQRNQGYTATLPLEQVTVNDGKTDPYGIGAIATEFLVSHVGMSKFVGVYREVGAGKSFASAFKASTGIYLSDFYLMFEDARGGLGVPRS